MSNSWREIRQMVCVLSSDTMHKLTSKARRTSQLHGFCRSPHVSYFTKITFGKINFSSQRPYFIPLESTTARLLGPNQLSVLPTFPEGLRIQEIFLFSLETRSMLEPKNLDANPQRNPYSLRRISRFRSFPRQVALNLTAYGACAFPRDGTTAV